MPLSWNEIRARAAKFSEEWRDAHYEKGQTQTFYNEFFEVFGRRRRDVAIYEEKVKKLDNKNGFIDLFWPGQLLVEQKSAGRSLASARAQATDYCLSLKKHEMPRYVLLSDFQTFQLLDLDENEEHHFTLAELPEKVRHFDFVAGYQKQKYKDQDPVNIKASQLMSNLHEQLEESGYLGDNLERLLVRLMFCLFADDTGIFQPDSFLRYVEDRTREDGSDLGAQLIHFFEVLDTPTGKRQSTLDEDLAAFPYVNGALFSDLIRTPSFNTQMRAALLECCYYNWSKVSPALFGSLFQTVMLPDEQRQGGAHYTGESNILKTIRPLFLDELRNELERILDDRSTQKMSRLHRFHEKLGTLTFFDPACGCGNFLILAYREIRLLEIELLQALYPTRVLDISDFSKVDVDQFYGIEIEEFPARIAEAAMWLTDHQMNMRLSETFGQAFVRLPLKKAAHIHHGNALTTNWTEVLPPDNCNYILGNPPFVGSKYMTGEQRGELADAFKGTKGAGILDYVTAWYGKAAQYIQNTNIKVAFVSTNSISQGEQVSVLWGTLLQKYGIKIHFAHQTFKWTIDEKKAKGMNVASVYVIIVGFAAHDTDEKYIYEYETLTSDPHQVKVKNISPYLVAGGDIAIQKRSKPLCDVPEIKFGNQPIDGGNLILSADEREEALKAEANISHLIRPFLGSRELINGGERYCLWLKDATPQEIRGSKFISNRLNKVKSFRLESKRDVTRELAKTPYLFGFTSHKEADYLAIPKVSSERRPYIPLKLLKPSTICSDLCLIVTHANEYHFGVLSSEMHMDWMRYVAGRLKSDYRYSNTLVYNNFPWPKVSEEQEADITAKAQAVLHARDEFPSSTLADLYAPNTMPPALLKAHQALDRAVDKAYRRAPFKDEKERIEHLFTLYQKLTAPLIETKRKTKRKT